MNITTLWKCKRIKMPRKIFLDCDPGHDDAIAILLALSSPSLSLLGISVVSGNQTLEKTARNALNVTRYLHSDVPIALGASKPLKRSRLNCGEIHGESGLDGFTFPEYELQYEKRDAVTFLKDTLLSQDKVTVVTTGPMTNLASALLQYPEIIPHIEEIISMGGSTDKGNLTPYAEFNILADAEAAKICFDSKIPMRMVGLNVTRKALVLPEIVERMDKIKTRSSKMFVALMKFFNKTQKEVFGLEGGPLHDPLTIACLLDDKILHFERMDVDVDISDSITYGQTRCKPNKESYIQVATGIDVDLFFDYIEKALRSC